MRRIQKDSESQSSQALHLRALSYLNHSLAKMWLRSHYLEGSEPLAVVRTPRHEHIRPKQVVAATVADAKKYLKQQPDLVTEKPKKKRRKIEHATLLAGLNTVAVIAIAISLSTGAIKTSTSSIEPIAQATPEAQSRYLPIVPIIKTQPLVIEETKKQHNTQLAAWVAPWNATDLAGQASTLKSASAFWATVDADGSTVLEKADFATWRTFKAQLREGTETYLTVSGDPDATYKTISNAETRTLFAANIINLAKRENFTGIDINFEALGSDNRLFFNEFLRSLLGALQSENLKLAVTLEARIANQVPMDWETVGKIADSVRIMAYDYHSQNTSSPGPISPIGWFEEVLRYAATTISLEKLSIGIPNYGYAWTSPSDPTASWTGKGISYARAVVLATEKGVEIVRKDGIDQRGYLIGKSPSFAYTNEDGSSTEVWFEDAVSIHEKLSIADQYANLDSAILWSVGPGDSKLWEVRQ